MSTAGLRGRYDSPPNLLNAKDRFIINNMTFLLLLIRKILVSLKKQSTCLKSSRMKKIWRPTSERPTALQQMLSWPMSWIFTLPWYPTEFTYLLLLQAPSYMLPVFHLEFKVIYPLLHLLQEVKQAFNILCMCKLWLLMP